MDTNPTAEFGAMLATVIGSALAAAGYTLIDSPVQQAAGLFRYTRILDSNQLTVDFQVLVYADAPARFLVTLQRHADTLPPVQVTLPALLWETFGVHLLSSPGHWWGYANAQAAGEALLEAGKLLFAYGLPWLEGTLNPEE